MSVDLLMITWNRFEYAKRTIDNLLSTHDDFTLYWWDNGSTDGAAEYIDKLSDSRIAVKHRNKENVMQAIPTRWFLHKSRANIIGKLDDDTLVPDGWIKTIRPAIELNSQLGMVGCWTFWPEDFERNASTALKKVRVFGEHRLLWNLGIGGTAFLMNREVAIKYLVENHSGTAFPIDRERMSVDGLCSGWYFPLVWAEHMDDPRSGYCLTNQKETKDLSALSARVRGFRSSKEFLEWIMRDADAILGEDTESQIRSYRFKQSFLGRGVSKIAHLSRRIIG